MSFDAPFSYLLYSDNSELLLILRRLYLSPNTNTSSSANEYVFICQR